MNYWVMKSEPSVFGIDDLLQKPNQIEPWEGVRNYQARNFIREMCCGDRAFFYHSNCKTPGIVGILKIATDPYPDSTAFDPSNRYFDPRSTPLNPRWYRVDVGFKENFASVISLSDLKKNPLLKNILLVQKGSRLSITPLNKDEWDTILEMRHYQ